MYKRIGEPPRPGRCDAFMCKGAAKHAYNIDRERPRTNLYLCDNCEKSMVESSPTYLKLLAEYKEVKSVMDTIKGEDADGSTNEDLESLDIDKLREIGKDLKLNGYNLMNRETLVRKITAMREVEESA